MSFLTAVLIFISLDGAFANNIPNGFDYSATQFGRTYLGNLREPRTFAEAQRLCSSIGATPLKIRNDEEFVFASNVARTLRSNGLIWLGIHKDGRKWDDGSDLYVEHWHLGRKPWHDECGGMGSTGFLIATECDKKFATICEKTR